MDTPSLGRLQLYVSAELLREGDLNLHGKNPISPSSAYLKISSLDLNLRGKNLDSSLDDAESKKSETDARTRLNFKANAGLN